ncbi:MAG: Acetophenone carboxylase gamma subunit [Pseudomonadales bacterium]|nr:Acetophenone carboxylase gamma subunit [Pseudomonadales bacterium]
MSAHAAAPAATGGNSIDIDVGGTFTDCFVQFEGRHLSAKAPTTHYDLSVCFREAIGLAAAGLGLDFGALVTRCDVVRYSTTKALNALLERRGPRLGLITTAGNEHVNLIGRSIQWQHGLNPAAFDGLAKVRRPEPLIPFTMTVGVRERVDYAGKVLMPIDADDVRRKVHALVDRGVEGFVVCLLWAHVNPVHERSVRELIEEMYPDVNLGAMPVYLSSEVAPVWHEYPRLNATTLNAFLQWELQDQFAQIGLDLRQSGHRRPLQIVSNVGGMAKASRTRALDTFGAGPVAGLFGAAYIGAQAGVGDIIVTDMGGTSFDFAPVSGGEVRYFADNAVIDRWLTEQPIIEVKSIGAGGGSIAWLNPAMGNRLEVGPRSAGSNPGPAAYGMGGREPTVTDADVVLGYLDPQAFLGGRMKLDRALAERAIRRRIAEPLGIDVIDAAAAIRRTIDATMGGVIAKEVLLKGLDIRRFSVFANGGAGPLHCVDFARTIRPDMVCYTFPYSSVFCAMSGTTMDLSHIYQRSAHCTLKDLSSGTLIDATGREAFNRVVEAMVREAGRDVLSEGFGTERIVFTLELDMRFGGQFHQTRTRSPHLRLVADTDIEDVLRAFEEEHARRYSKMSLFPEGTVEVETIHLLARVPLPKPRLPEIAAGTRDASAARIGSREVYWTEVGRHAPTAIYDAVGLRAGNVIDGPAIVQAPDTTILVPGDRELAVDRFGNGVIRPH